MAAYFHNPARVRGVPLLKRLPLRTCLSSFARNFKDSGVRGRIDMLEHPDLNKSQGFGFFDRSRSLNKI